MILLSQDVDWGDATTKPGSYFNFTATSSSGIGGFRFISKTDHFGSQVEGNTSIDNVIATRTGESIPEPGTWMLLGGALTAVRVLRSRRKF
ncbi:MAG: PEP-CTERM sorting domain-containing protein [Bryobacter sp.]|nr:PEP-CTERM sorting domain-containing protein [Bryobacter sp. CoA8 C33]